MPDRTLVLSTIAVVADMLLMLLMLIVEDDDDTAPRPTFPAFPNPDDSAETARPTPPSTRPKTRAGDTMNFIDGGYQCAGWRESPTKQMDGYGGG